jgi:hypothetical protein
MRIKIIKTNNKYQAGTTVEVSKNVGFGLIDSGIGIVSKDIITSEIKTTGVKSGRITKLRSNKSS